MHPYKQGLGKTEKYCKNWEVSRLAYFKADLCYSCLSGAI